MKHALPQDKAVVVQVRRLAHAQGLPLPAYQTWGAAGMDLLAAIPEEALHIILRGERSLLPTGLAIVIPAGYEGQVRPRSGLALRDGLTVLNSPGTIDSDYRGEIKVLLINLGEDAVTLRRGDRIAQLVIAPVASAHLIEVEEITTTVRGEGGFGSTGTQSARKPR